MLGGLLSGRFVTRLLLPAALLCLVVGSYVYGWWVVSLQTRDSHGNTRFRVVARINWYYNPTESSAESDPKQVYSSHELKNRVEEPDETSNNSVSSQSLTTRPPNIKHSIQLHQAPRLKQYNIYNQNQPEVKELDFQFNAINQDINVLIEKNIPDVRVKEVNCRAIADGDRAETIKAGRYQRYQPRRVTPDEEYIKRASDCQAFITDRKYATEPLSEEEAEFSIAYSLLMFKDVEQTERLLRAIYRPQNFYCIHIDLKSSTVIWNAMRAIVKCFDNVFLASRSVNVQWGWYSVLEPEIICMEDLWKYKKWRYFINLTGQEFPLQTNWDIVKVLKALKGANNAEGTVKRRNRERTLFVHRGIFSDFRVKKPPPPIKLRLSKGSLHVVVQRGFVDYVLHNNDALALREWVKDTGVPDETFFSSIIYSPNLNVPGSYKGEPETDKIDDRYRSPRNPFIARFKNWGTWPFNWDCNGKRIRMVCIFGIGDLPLLAKRKELFANKFYADYHPLLYDCLEEIHYNRTRNEVLGKVQFSDEFYSKLDIVNNHVT